MARQAACALVLRLEGGELQALTVSRKRDAADVGLPGGAREASDATLLDAAKRELAEETGLRGVDVPLALPLLSADGPTGNDAELVAEPCETHTFLMTPQRGAVLEARAETETGVVAWSPWRAALGSSKSFAAYNARLAEVVARLLPAIVEVVKSTDDAAAAVALAEEVAACSGSD
jgi:8-oxo-dGTP pyrophosphatase MutT (NUDIX family)